MEGSCKITCSGRCKVGAWWKTTAKNGLNRLYYINGGTGGYIRDGKQSEFKKGMIYFIPYYSNVTTYTDLNDELDHTFVGIILSPPVLSTDVFCLDPKSSAHLQRAVDCLISLCEDGTLQKAEETLLESLSTYIVEAAVTAQPQSVISDTVVLDALEMMHSFEDGVVTVKDMAEKCHMSVNGFIKRFTKFVGETPYVYYKKLRLQFAQSHRALGATLSEAAALSGYSDGSALLHAIKGTK